MPELRQNPLTGAWVAVSEERARRPLTPIPPAPDLELAHCPFCPGNEATTPPPVLQLDRDGAWSLRVVPNSFPALRVEETSFDERHGPWRRAAGIGAHEVVIESRDHHDHLHRRAPERIAELLRAFQVRILDLRRDQRLAHIQAFRNHGYLSGASLVHPHSQIIATPMVPPGLARQLERARWYHEVNGRCLLCDVAREELRDRRRLVYESDAVLGIAPFASRFPFEVWLLPREHASHFETADEAQLLAFARALKEVSSRLDGLLAPARGTDAPSMTFHTPFNLVVQSAPPQHPSLSHFHWYIELLPRFGPPLGGFELGADCQVNPIPPEIAARELRPTPTRAE
jgi:UDPglucose--hexose-1-phosphate uridylyltransferase